MYGSGKFNIFNALMRRVSFSSKSKREAGGESALFA